MMVRWLLAWWRSPVDPRRFLIVGGVSVGMGLVSDITWLAVPQLVLGVYLCWKGWQEVAEIVHRPNRPDL